MTMPVSDTVLLALIVAIAPILTVIGTWANQRIAAKAAARLVEAQAAKLAEERAIEVADTHTRLSNIETKVDGQHTALVAKLDVSDQKVEGLVRELSRADRLQTKTEDQLKEAIVAPAILPIEVKGRVNDNHST
jgi:hypothetical protein